MRLLLLKSDSISESLKTYFSLYQRVEGLTIKKYSDFKEAKKKTEVSFNLLKTVPVLYDFENNLGL